MTGDQLPPSVYCQLAVAPVSAPSVLVASAALMVPMTLPTVKEDVIRFDGFQGKAACAARSKAVPLGMSRSVLCNDAANSVSFSSAPGSVCARAAGLELLFVEGCVCAARLRVSSSTATLMPAGPLLLACLR